MPPPPVTLVLLSCALGAHALAPTSSLALARGSSSRSTLTMGIFGFGDKEEDSPVPVQAEVMAPEAVQVAESIQEYRPKTDMELAEQSARLDALAAKWKSREIAAEDEANSLIGWTKQSEEINGRLAMFFLLTGLVTEYYTGQSLPQQVYTLLETLSIVD